MPLLEKDEQRRPTLKQAKLLKIQRQIKESRRAREPMVRIWDAIYASYKSDPTTNYDVESEFMLQVNLAYAWYESMWPSLLFRNPRFLATAESPEAESQVKTVNSALNGELRDIGLKRELRRAGFDFLLKGVGILTLGYYSSGLVPSSVTSPTGEGGAGGIPPPPSDGRKKRRSSDHMFGFEEERMYVRAIRPQNFLPDPMSSDLDNALWCGIEYTRDLEAVKRDPQYENTENLEANAWALPRGMSESQYREMYSELPEMDLVRIVQYIDMVDNKVYVVTAEHDKFLGEYDLVLPVKRFPVYVARASDDEEDFWCQPPMAAWLNLVEEHNIAISRRLNHTSRHFRRYLYDTDAVKPEDVDVLTRPEHAAIPVSAAGGDVRMKVAPLADAPVSPDSYAFTRESLDLWRFVSGMNELDMGAMRPGERPAAETERMAAGSNARRSALGERLESMLMSFASDARAIMERYYSKERVVSITGDLGNTEWVKYSGSDLKGEFLFSCRITDMAFKSPEDTKREAAELMQLLAPLTQIGSPQPMLDAKPIVQRVLDEMGVRDVRWFPTANPPMDPSQEWFLITQKGADLEPNMLDDHQYHEWHHEQQLIHVETLKSPSAVERLRNHLHRHRALRLSAEMQMQQPGSEGQGGGGTQGPQNGTSNNPSGGAGLYAGGAGEQNVDQMGGFSGQNIRALMRGGGA